MTLDKYGVLELGDVALEDRFIRGVGVPILVSGLDLAGPGTSLLLHLGLVLCGDVLNVFCNNVEINTVP